MNRLRKAPAKSTGKFVRRDPELVEGAGASLAKLWEPAPPGMPVSEVGDNAMRRNVLPSLTPAEEWCPTRSAKGGKASACWSRN